MIEKHLPLASLLDSAPDGFVVTDADGRIVWANRTAGELFGYGENGLVGRQIEELVPGRLRRKHKSHRRAYQASSRVRPMGLGLNLLGRKHDGSEFPLEISLSPLQTSDGLLVTAVVRDVTEHRRLESERNFLAVELQTERERDRIAMDLHDGIMQDIYAAALTLELALSAGEGEGSADAKSVDRAIDQLHEVVSNIRSYIFDLRPRQFSGTLAEALADLAEEFRQNSQIDTDAQISLTASVDPATAVVLYHIAHESLSNIRRHAKASHASIALSFSEHTGRLEIIDDGVGFDSAAVVSEKHRGLRNIAARAKSVQGSVTIESSAGQGTHLSVTFPLAEAQITTGGGAEAEEGPASQSSAGERRAM